MTRPLGAPDGNAGDADEAGSRGTLAAAPIERHPPLADDEHRARARA